MLPRPVVLLTRMDVFIDSRFDGVFERYPIVLADVGARGGLKQNWLATRRHLRLWGFEPDKEEFSRLEQRTRAEGLADVYFNVALHNRLGPVSVYVARDRGLSSIFEPNRPFLDLFPDAGRFDTVSRLEVQADTLDGLMARRNLTDLDFIKADTQGSELFVLQGAAEALAASVVGVEVEVEFAPIYKGQPLFADLDSFMRGLGYSLFDLRPCYWKRADGRDLGGPYGQIVWADALYLKSVGALGEAAAKLDQDARKGKILKALAISLLYGYADYALEIAGRTGDLWSPDERAAIDHRLRARTGAREARPSLPSWRRFGAALRQLRSKRPADVDAWSVSDAEVGNLE
jgi:FkbM family methyltransferase